MTITREVEDIFADARQLHQSALERLEAGDIRDAAEKAWCATLRSSSALILALEDGLPERTPDISFALKRLGNNNPHVDRLGIVGRYYYVQGALHGDCFYHGKCDADQDGQLIRAVSRYIQDAEQLAEEQQ